MQDISKIQEEIEQSNGIGLGYPVNREHAFNIDMRLLGLKKHSFASTFLNNVGSPYHVSGYTRDRSREVEVALMNLLSTHFQLCVEDSFGYVTSGGTEANFVSIWWHRNYLKDKFQEMPFLLTSNRSHYSIKKIANQLNIEFIPVLSDMNGINLQELEATIAQVKSPIIFSANLGNSMDGAIDDILHIYDLLTKYCGADRFKIHVDGAIYGLMVPYLPQLNINTSIFAYADTLAFSGHKFLGCLHVCGVALARKSYIDLVFKDSDITIKMLSGAIDATFAGSRSGFLPVELYLLINEALKIDNNGKTKLYNLWQECLNNAIWFHNELNQITKEFLHYNKGQLCIVFKSPENLLNKDFLAKKYTLMPIGNHQFGIYVLPSRTKEKLTQFLYDYKKLII